MRIGIDLLGSDTPPVSLFNAVLHARHLPALTFVIFATSSIRRELLLSKPPKNIEFCVVSECIQMGDDPISSVRSHPNTSIAIALNMLKENRVDGFITLGNTGALITAASLILPKLPLIKRPALLAVLPTLQNPLTIVDVGGNVSCRKEHLVQFAQLGALFHCCRQQGKQARVGLLNIGSESKKGTKVLQETHKHLEALSEKRAFMEFIGNIEARDVLKGKIDVLVTDGFTGNVLLKASEGVASCIFDHMAKLASLQGLSVISDLRTVFSPATQAGAIVCGVDRLAMKCHGNASELSLYHSILAMKDYIDSGLLSYMRSSLLQLTDD